MALGEGLTGGGDEMEGNSLVETNVHQQRAAPLKFQSQAEPSHWPPYLELGGSQMPFEAG